MNKPKSLSDSSTSESEDDYGKRRNSNPCETWSGLKRTRSTDEEADLFYKLTNQNASFKNPNKYSERRFSTDDTEDEHFEAVEPPAKQFKSDFKNPGQYIKREASTDQSDSESDEKQSSMRSFTSMSMPSMETATVNSNYGPGAKLMEKMGYKSGTGLGKYEQGRVNIVEASKQRGRRGLGLQMAPGLEPSDSQWDASQEEILLTEEVSWLPNCTLPLLSLSELREWMVEGEKKENIDDETEFCDPDILRQIVSAKSVFDNLEPEEMRKARTRSNPFETIRGGIFLNRAAMKMANMDAVFDFMFTNPKKINGKPAVGPNELLYFADVCAGPGGFSEYVLWRRKWECKGFGFTLKSANDFKLEDFFSGGPETFEPYYGEDEDGNVYTARNLRSFQKFVRASTDGQGVHFMMADGGFSVEGRENEQEILSKRLYLCQFLCSLLILRTGGHFVCKLFDVFTPFSVGLVYLMWMAFEKVCIFKPNTSRPANSERYIICKWLKPNIRDISDYMFEINEILDKYEGTVQKKDVTDIVPLHVLKENEEFYEYIVESNNKLGAKQILHLNKIRLFAQNVALHEERQSDIRKKSLELWNVPDKVRSAPPKADPEAKYKEILQGENLSYISSTPLPLTEHSLKKLENIFDFYCVVCGESKTPPSLFIGLGKSNIFQYDLQSSKWKKIEATLELPANTLFYGELLLELKGESRAQKKIASLHIIDVICLGGTDVRKLHFTERMQMAQKLAKAVSKPSRTDFAPLRVKLTWKLQNVDEIFDRLAMKFIKNSQVPRLCYDLGDGRHIIPSGLLIFKTTADKWTTAFSKTNQRIYFFNTKTKESIFEIREDASANFKSCFSQRIFWSWERGVRLIKEQINECKDSVVHGKTMTDFVKYHLHKATGRS